MPLMVKSMLPERAVVAVSLVFTFVVDAFELVGTGFVSGSFKSREV